MEKSSLLAIQLPLEEKLLDEIHSSCEVLKVSPDQQIVEAGKYIKMVPLLIEGSIRVFQEDVEADREILLYYVNPGETCMMSLGACFGDKKSEISAVTEEMSSMILIPTSKVREWQRTYPTWNEFIIQTFRRRYTDLLSAFNDVSFKRIEERLMEYLTNYQDRKNTNVIPLSHQKIANELGTTRVVISRLLKKFENDDLLELHRKAIVLKK